MQVSLVIALSFFSGLLLSPWSGGLLLTIFYILIIEIVYSYIWQWGLWRLAVIFASLIGWALVRAILTPILNFFGVKQWVDSFIPDWCGVQYWKNKFITPSYTSVPLQEVVIPNDSMEFSTPYVPISYL